MKKKTKTYTEQLKEEAAVRELKRNGFERDVVAHALRSLQWEQECMNEPEERYNEVEKAKEAIRRITKEGE